MTHGVTRRPCPPPPLLPKLMFQGEKTDAPGRFRNKTLPAERDLRGETRVWSDDIVDRERLGMRGSVTQEGFLEKVASET